MEIKDYITMVRRWAWLLAAGLALGMAGGFLGSIFQTPIYQASTRVLVLRASQAEKNTDTYLGDQQLVQTYIQLLTTRPVLEGASAQLGFDVKASQVYVNQIRDMQAIQLTVEDSDPQRAADIANILVQVLISQNEQIQTGRYALTEQSIQAQITQVEDQIDRMSTEIENVSVETVQQQLLQVEAQISTMQAEVTQLQTEIQQLTPPASTEQQTQLNEKEARLNQIQPVLSLSQQIYADLLILGKPSTSQDETTRLSQLQTTLKLYQEIYINLLNNLEAIRLARLQNTPNVVPIEAAVVPANPIRPKPLTTTGLGAVLGLLLAGGVVFLIEYMDDTIRTPEDIERILKLPVIGYIGEIAVGTGEAVDVHVLKHPRSPVSEAFRSLRTNLEFTNVDRSLKKILVTSSGPGEGKTMISVNLASIIAQGGKKVLLLDADMRRPRIHKIFGVSNRVGLSTLFRGNATVRSVMKPVDGMSDVFLITSGSLPPNPAELLASAKMDSILEEAGLLVDVIIVDSPPSLVSDFQVLATKLDGVLMVIQPGHTHADAAFAMLEQLGRVDGRGLGVVLNKIPRNNYYGGYQHYYYPSKKGEYYYQHEPEAQSQPPIEVSPIKYLPQAQSQPTPIVDPLPAPVQPIVKEPENIEPVAQVLDVPVPPEPVATIHEEMSSPLIVVEQEPDLEELSVSEPIAQMIESPSPVNSPMFVEEPEPTVMETVTEPSPQWMSVPEEEPVSYVIKFHRLEYFVEEYDEGSD